MGAARDFPQHRTRFHVATGISALAR